ncbi:MAG: hypothetical protein H0W64_01790 [Gammaproteobacteria bacterium]|nr:hypothetical protein [Gammaproteobacteria bacterium]
MTKRLITTVLSIILVTGMTTALADHQYERIHCQPINYYLEPRGSDYYMVKFLCKENLEKLFNSPTGIESPYMALNWINKTKYSENLIKDAIKSHKYYQVVTDGPYFRIAQTFDGINVS